MGQRERTIRGRIAYCNERIELLDAERTLALADGLTEWVERHRLRIDQFHAEVEHLRDELGRITR